MQSTNQMMSRMHQSPSTVKDCANGSLCAAFVLTLISTSVGFALGLGGFLTETLLVFWVRIVPDPL